VGFTDSIVLVYFHFSSIWLVIGS